MYSETSFSSLTIQSLHTLISKYDHEAMLSSCLDIYVSFSKNWKIKYSLGTECCLCWRYIYTIVEICSFPGESTFILWNRECDIEITISIISLIPFSTEFYCHTILDSFRDIDGFLNFFSDLPCCMTIGTFFCDFFSFSMTRSTWSSLFHNPEDCLNPFANLSLTVTGFTLLCFSSLPTTMMTGGCLIVFDLATHSEDSIFERYLESHLDIFTDICTRSRFASSPTHTSTEE
jgi:hypothetical protein